jgi:integration host factor subunit alpha
LEWENKLEKRETEEKERTMKITRQWIAGLIYNHHPDLSKERCREIIESLFEIMKDELQKGHPVRISGFGKWSVREKKQRMGRNPQTGEVAIIKARRVVTFKCSHKFKDKERADA